MLQNKKSKHLVAQRILRISAERTAGLRLINIINLPICQNADNSNQQFCLEQIRKIHRSFRQSFQRFVPTKSAQQITTGSNTHAHMYLIED